MIKKIILTGIIILCYCNAIAQEEKLRVAVFDPTTSGIEIAEGTKLAVQELISSAFVNTGKFTIVERSMIDKIMKEQAFQNSDMADNSQATEVGKLAGANKVVLSAVSRVEGRNMLSIKVIDVQTATVDQQKTKIVSSSDLLDVVEPLTMELLGEKAVYTKQETTFAQPQQEVKEKEPTIEEFKEAPKINFSKREIETFDGNKFGWEKVKGAKISKGHFSLKGTRNPFSASPVAIRTSANLPLDPQKDFKITIRLIVVEFDETTIFSASLSQGSINFNVAKNSWAVINNKVACQGVHRIKDGDYISLSIQKSGNNLFFSYKDDLLCTIKVQKIQSSNLLIQLFNIVSTSEAQIDEIVVEQ
jgi:hypothetical protein